MSTFITRLDAGGSGVRLAVKDLIDMAGLPTTAGCRAVADRAQPTAADAACLAGARAAGARIVGRTNLHELAFGTTGINPWFGTPVNPLDPELVPGGSSSGSAVAVATDEADVALGSDTGGSVRIPAACCGIAGLKTTWGRIPLDGVWPLAASFDTIGPLARDVAGLVTGMELLEPGFAPASDASIVIGRVRLPDVNPIIEAAVDAAIAAAELEVVEIELPGWDAATGAGLVLLLAEAWAADRELVEAHPDGIGADVVERLELGRMVDEGQVAAAAMGRSAWRAELDGVFEQVQLLALPTLNDFPPTLERADDVNAIRCTVPLNTAGVPALAIPVPADSRLPASIQLVGPHGGEELLLSVGLSVEAASAP